MCWDILASSYARSIKWMNIQDCSIPQHAIVYYTCTRPSRLRARRSDAGDFRLAGQRADRLGQVCLSALSAGWRVADALALEKCEHSKHSARWLLDTPSVEEEGKPIDLRSAAPPEVSWVHLDGVENRARQLLAPRRTKAPDRDRTVLIIDARAPARRASRNFASQTPGAVTVEAVDLKDLVTNSREIWISIVLTRWPPSCPLPAR